MAGGTLAVPDLGPVFRALVDAVQQVNDTLYEIFSEPGPSTYEAVIRQTSDWGIGEWAGVEVFLRLGEPTCGTEEIKSLWDETGWYRLAQLREPWRDRHRPTYDEEPSNE